ncbi:MAG: hypothetical protein AB7U30_08020 [Sulfuricellaceae bacterium]
MIREVGKPGKVIVTNLTRLLMPVIRYPAGDRAIWLEEEGPPDRKFKILGRSEEGARVGPITLYVEDVWHILEPFRDRLQIVNFQMVIDHYQQRDQMTLRIAVHGGDAELAAAKESVIATVYANRPMFPELLRQGLVHPLAVEWVSAADLEINPRTGKLKRVLDRRQEGK